MVLEHVGHPNGDNYDTIGVICAFDRDSHTIHAKSDCLPSPSTAV